MVFTDEQLLDMKNEYISLLRSTNRKGIENLINWLDTKSDFFYAPASTYYHNSVKGGLVNHSLNVYKAAKHILEGAKLLAISEKNISSITEESLIICTLLHDLCKTNFYSPVQKVWKDESLPSPQCWKKYMSYEIKDRFPVGHGEKSVIMAQVFISLTASEICAIRWHMGFTDCGSFLSPYEKPALMAAMNDIPLVGIVAEADHFASFMMEPEINQKVDCQVF